VSRTLAVVCYPSLGGSGIIATELAQGLAARGHTLHVITSGPLSRELPKSSKLHLHIAQAPSYPLFEHTPYLLGLSSTIAQVCRDERVDLLHVHYAVPHAASALLARQMLGAHAPALVTTLHGSDVTRVGVEPAYHEVTRFCVEASDAITTPSIFLREQAHELLGIPRARSIEVIENAVDTERFSPAAARDTRQLDALFSAAASSGERPKTLMHVSNFRAVKRTLDLIDVLAELNNSCPARLVLVGDGPERAQCEARVRSLGLQSRVAFLGALTSFTEHLQQADAFVLTSESESFGLAALEAMSCGVPVFGYRVGGLGGVVTQDVGRLVPAFDRSALSRALSDVLRDEALRSQLARAARQRAQTNFRMQPTLERYEVLFERLCSKRAR
jgi:N-acetyl-alpha-D-glucosaminyl L-malate synthase BshA